MWRLRDEQITARKRVKRRRSTHMNHFCLVQPFDMSLASLSLSLSLSLILLLRLLCTANITTQSTIASCCHHYRGLACLPLPPKLSREGIMAGHAYLKTTGLPSATRVTVLGLPNQWDLNRPSSQPQPGFEDIGSMDQSLLPARSGHSILLTGGPLHGLPQ